LVATDLHSRKPAPDSRWNIATRFYQLCKNLLESLFMMKNLFLRSAVGLSLLVSVSTPAATLTTVPMQGGMVMPMVAYHAEHNHLHVMMPVEIPQLTPLLVSHPADQFAPTDPWFDFIDPSRQGASFSLRYGFVMDANSDPLPPGQQMWIRKLSGSPELKAYRYRATEPKAWTPIFGTDGATNAMYWNGMMFHPAFTAPPGTHALTATFELYMLDTTTGLEVPDASSGPLVFNWTNVPDGRPALSLAPKIVVAWPAETPENWVLESAAAANAVTWNVVTNAPVLVDGKLSAVLDGNAAQQVFRMRYVP
jgi:hypothetical protein